MPKGISLHIGVNRCSAEHYAGWEGPLNACENDCDDMAAIAKAQGFKATQLKTAEATRQAVADQLRKAADELTEGDLFLMTYSGHGGRITDVNNDEDDGKDETWCLYDGQMLDDEFNVAYAAFKEGVRILVISDSCHSGTVSKSAGPPKGEDPAGFASRHMPRRAAHKTQKKRRDFYGDIQRALPNPRPPIKATFRLMSSCQDDQRAYEGKINGLFTQQLKKTWADGKFEGTLKSFHKSILKGMHEGQDPNYLKMGNDDESLDKGKPFVI